MAVPKVNQKRDDLKVIRRRARSGCKSAARVPRGIETLSNIHIASDTILEKNLSVTLIYFKDNVQILYCPEAANVVDSNR